MLWDLIQQRQIGQARQSAAEASSSADRTRAEVTELEKLVESLTLTCQAMWELLRKQGDLTDEMLMKKMEEVDLRDGQRDGRIGVQPSQCSACSRPNNPRHQSCVYCGKPLPPPKHVFA